MHGIYSFFMDLVKLCQASLTNITMLVTVFGGFEYFRSFWCGIDNFHSTNVNFSSVLSLAKPAFISFNVAQPNPTNSFAA